MVSLTATVHAQDGSLPTGTVDFCKQWRANRFSAAEQPRTVSAYNALPVGTDNLVATSGGSSTLAAQHMNTVMQVVNRDPHPHDGDESRPILRPVESR